jgi:hypothetical protein
MPEQERDLIQLSAGQEKLWKECGFSRPRQEPGPRAITKFAVNWTAATAARIRERARQ